MIPPPTITNSVHTGLPRRWGVVFRDNIRLYFRMLPFVAVVTLFVIVQDLLLVDTEYSGCLQQHLRICQLPFSRLDVVTFDLRPSQSKERLISNGNYVPNSSAQFRDMLYLADMRCRERVCWYS